jgi:hypothetical protein
MFEGNGAQQNFFIFILIGCGSIRVGMGKKKRPHRKKKHLLALFFFVVVVALFVHFGGDISDVNRISFY